MTSDEITVLSRLTPVAGWSLDSVSQEGRWWADCLVHAVALDRFYRKRGVTRLCVAMNRLVETAREGMARDGDLIFVRPISAQGESTGALAADMVPLDGVIEWWKAGMQASYGLAAVMGLPGMPDYEILGALPSKHHKAWRLGFRIVTPDADQSRVLIETCGAGAPEFLGLVAERYMERAVASHG